MLLTLLIESLSLVASGSKENLSQRDVHIIQRNRNVVSFCFLVLLRAACMARYHYKQGHRWVIGISLGVFV